MPSLFCTKGMAGSCRVYTGTVLCLLVRIALVWVATFSVSSVPLCSRCSSVDRHAHLQGARIVLWACGPEQFAKFASGTSCLASSLGMFIFVLLGLFVGFVLSLSCL